MELYDKNKTIKPTSLFKGRKQSLSELLILDSITIIPSNPIPVWSVEPLDFELKIAHLQNMYVAIELFIGTVDMYSLILLVKRLTSTVTMGKPELVNVSPRQVDYRVGWWLTKKASSIRFMWESCQQKNNNNPRSICILPQFGVNIT
ncbi:hypothetical protein J6590_044027 [Homalodisca vitripennis]|nr:hypothetical protein J6590_044027 [Homalodisca vitripennis]